MNLYAESSAVLSWLLGEDRHSDVRRSLRAADLILTSDLTLIECHRVLIRGVALKEISEKNAESRRKRLLSASAAWYVLRVSGDVADRARQPFPVEPIRTLDALHLASALTGRTAVANLGILSLDDRIRSAALQLGFVVLPEVRKRQGAKTQRREG